MPKWVKNILCGTALWFVASMFGLVLIHASKILLSYPDSFDNGFVRMAVVMSLIYGPIIGLYVRFY